MQAEAVKPESTWLSPYAAFVQGVGPHPGAEDRPGVPACQCFPCLYLRSMQARKLA